MPNSKENKSKLSNNKRKRNIIILVISIITAVAVAISACAVYLGDYYKADEKMLESFDPMSKAEFYTSENGDIIFEVQGAKTGFIFYPGGKVDNHAYKGLMAELSTKGVFCIIAKMPFNLAVFDINAAKEIQEEYPQIENWYIGGHSLGGAMAASYVSDHTEDFKGLVLLGAYSTSNLSKSGLDVLSVYGSEDKIMNRDKYNENISNLPQSFKELVIKGGCHAYFGMYGNQDGDGNPSITNQEQIYITANAIAQLMGL